MRHNARCSTPCTWAKLFAIGLSSAQRPGRNPSYQTPGHVGHIVAAKGSVIQSSGHTSSPKTGTAQNADQRRENCISESSLDVVYVEFCKFLTY